MVFHSSINFYCWLSLWTLYHLCKLLSSEIAFSISTKTILMIRCVPRPSHLTFQSPLSQELTYCRSHHWSTYRSTCPLSMKSVLLYEDLHLGMILLSQVLLVWSRSGHLSNRNLVTILTFVVCPLLIVLKRDKSCSVSPWPLYEM